MSKPVVQDDRYDFRGGRNTAISSDLLNTNELVDTTNIRLDTIYGGITKRTGTQRIHQTAFPNAIDGVFQWDSPSGKQIVVISDGKFYYRNGFNYGTAFSTIATPGVARSTGNGTDVAKAWSGGTTGTGTNELSIGVGHGGNSSTNPAVDRLVCKLGDPNQVDGSNIPATDSSYTLSGFILNLDTTGVVGVGQFSSSVSFEYSTDLGLSWTPFVGTYSIVTDGSEQSVTSTKFGPITFSVPGGPANVWIRPIFVLISGGNNSTSGTLTGSIQVYNTAWLVDIFTFSWVTGAPGVHLGGNVTFIPFRAASAGAPLALYFSSNNHYWSWDGLGTLLLLDPTASAPAALTIAAYHTRMFATTSTQPKNLFWSKIGDATSFTTGTKTDGGSALADFLTGNALIAMEVIGSSLLLATTEALIRFTGHASDDIVISQDTEGISTEVGVIGAGAMKRYENTCAFMSDRGPYAATETYVQAIGEQLNPDWLTLDNANLAKTSIEYHRGRKELWFAVPRATDGGLCKSIFVQSVRLNAWQGPWTYPFGITYLTKYVNFNGDSNILAGGSDGFIRLMDVSAPTTDTEIFDDLLYNGTGGAKVTMTVELPVIHFGIPAIKKALKWILLQADLPIGSNLIFNISFDNASFTPFPVIANDQGEADYRVEVSGDTSQGFRPRIQIIDDSNYSPIIYGISTIAWNYQRTS